MLFTYEEDGASPHRCQLGGFYDARPCSSIFSIFNFFSANTLLKVKIKINKQIDVQ